MMWMRCLTFCRTATTARDPQHPAAGDDSPSDRGLAGGSRRASATLGGAFEREVFEGQQKEPSIKLKVADFHFKTFQFRFLTFLKDFQILATVFFGLSELSCLYFRELHFHIFSFTFGNFPLKHFPPFGFSCTSNKSGIIFKT